MAEKTLSAQARQKHKPDWWLLVLMLLILAVGIIMVYSSSQYMASYEPYNDSYYFLKAQLENAGLGFILLFLAYKLNFRWYRRLTWPAFLGVLGLMIFMVVSGSIETVGGAERWMQVGGMNLQPTELTKIALPMTLALWLSQRKNEVESFKIGFLPPLLLIGLFCLLIYKQQDLSSAIVVGVTGLLMMYCAGVKVVYLGSLGLAGVAVCVAAIVNEGYRMDRVKAWLDPWAYAGDEGYQTIQSLLALGNGGLTGVGLGSGGSKWFYLPEGQTDFIFSVWGEEAGFIGAVTLVLLYMLLIWRGTRVAVRQRGTYASLLAIGLSASLGVQILMNLFVATGVLPVTGITLPFMSYGGSSLVVCMTMIGMLMNISRYETG